MSTNGNSSPSSSVIQKDTPRPLPPTPNSRPALPPKLPAPQPPSTAAASSSSSSSYSSDNLRTNGNSNHNSLAASSAQPRRASLNENGMDANGRKINFNNENGGQRPTPPAKKPSLTGIVNGTPLTAPPPPPPPPLRPPSQRPNINDMKSRKQDFRTMRPQRSSSGHIDANQMQRSNSDEVRVSFEQVFARTPNDFLLF